MNRPRGPGAVPPKQAAHLSDAARSCLQRYDLARVEVVRELPGGMFARPLLLSTERGKFVFRRHTFRPTEAAFRFQAETMQWAFEHDVACVPVTPTSDGAWSVPWPERDAPGAAALHPFVEGVVCNWHAWSRRKETEPNLLREVGRQIAHMHSQLIHAHPAGDPELAVALPPIQFASLERVYQSWRDDLGRLADEAPAQTAAHQQLQKLSPRIERHWIWLLDAARQRRVEALPRQIVHGDVSAVNIVWNSQGRGVLIDWDAVHVGHRLYDALGDVLNRVPDSRRVGNRYRHDHVAEYLAGYGAGLEDPLSDHEYDLVETFCHARQLEDLRQRVASIRSLAPHDDQRYARLILMRVDMMDQIVAASEAK